MGENAEKLLVGPIISSGFEGRPSLCHMGGGGGMGGFSRLANLACNRQWALELGPQLQ